MTEETTPQTTEDSAPSNQPATRKEVLAPLATYGVVAIGIVAIIITTAIMLNSELNTIEQDVAQLETDLAAKNAAEMKKQQAQQTATAEQTETDPIVSETVVAKAENAADADTSASQNTTDNSAATSNTQAVSEAATEIVAAASSSQPATAKADKPVTETKVAMAENADAATSNDAKAQQQVASPSGAADNNTTVASTDAEQTAEARRQAFMQEIRAMMKQRIAEQQAMMQQRDQEQLESYKAAMSKQIELLQQQIEHTQSMIADIEKRNQAIYQMRAASIEQRRERREAAMEDMLNRI